MCVERMKQCDDIVALAAELDIHRRLLYRWRDQLDPIRGVQYASDEYVRVLQEHKMIPSMSRRRS
jgi:transposase-like protein